VPPAAPNPELLTTPVTDDGTVRTVGHGAEPEPGALLGQFRVETRLGKGGLGIVYRAYDEKLERAVALKVLAEASSTAGARLLDEARAAASLMHPAIAAIHDVQQHDGVAFIVMELVPGKTLRAEMARGPIDAASAIRFARDIASGLACAHRNGITHRDLKPENVMVTPEGAAKILDFGLARRVADAPPPSGKSGEVTGVAGTAAYMAPEQARGGRVDARADVFALGVVVYEMLAGRRPFDPSEKGGGSEAWAMVVPLAVAAPGAPAALVDVVERCLAVDPAARFANGGEVLDALRPLDGAARAPRSSKSTRLVAFVAAAALVLSAGAFAVRRLTHGRAEATPLAVPESAVAPTPAANDPATTALRADFERARSAWRAGDERAGAMLEQIVHTAESTGVAASTPASHVVAEALFLLGDLDEKTIVAPPPREPTTIEDLGPDATKAAQSAAWKVAKRYSDISFWGWGASDLVVCGQIRTAHAAEKLIAIARAVEARELAAMERPAVEALYPGGRAQLEVGWSSTISSFRGLASGYYDAAVSTARFVAGPVIDPLDGSDCRAIALARRDALAADAGP
jgi:hypothetical protein